MRSEGSAISAFRRGLRPLFIPRDCQPWRFNCSDDHRSPSFSFACVLAGVEENTQIPFSYWLVLCSAALCSRSSLFHAALQILQCRVSQRYCRNTVIIPE